VRATIVATQVTLPSVAIAMQSLGTVMEGSLSLSASEQRAVQVLLGLVRPHLFVASPQQLSQLAQGLCFMQMVPPEGWLGEYSKVRHCLGGNGRRVHLVGGE
jgi:hypothetical protein